MRKEHQKLTVMEAYKHFNTKPANINWSWSGSGTGADGSINVSITLWQHELQMVGGLLTYIGSLNDGRLGARELTKHLRLARECCSGRVNVIIAIARDPRAAKLSVLRRFPASFTMLVKQLDLETGTYRLEIERDDLLAAA